MKWRPLCYCNLASSRSQTTPRFSSMAIWQNLGLGMRPCFANSSTACVIISSLIQVHSIHLGRSLDLKFHRKSARHTSPTLNGRSFLQFSETQWCTWNTQNMFSSSLIPRPDTAGLVVWEWDYNLQLKHFPTIKISFYTAGCNINCWMQARTWLMSSD